MPRPRKAKFPCAHHPDREAYGIGEDGALCRPCLQAAARYRCASPGCKDRPGYGWLRIWCPEHAARLGRIRETITR